MFRQDRTNPSTAISNWRGRLDTLKGWPSTAVSTWLNGGLFGGAAALTAFGGIITQYVDSGDSKTYRVHTFRGSGKFLVSSGTADVDYLIVAGGGGGGGYGAGGAGGVSEDTSGSVAVSAGTYTITVGTGGAGGTAAGDRGTSGVNSEALGVTAVVGGGGGGAYSDSLAQALSGGSGGAPAVFPVSRYQSGNPGAYVYIKCFKKSSGVWSISNSSLIAIECRGKENNL